MKMKMIIFFHVTKQTRETVNCLAVQMANNRHAVAILTDKTTDEQRSVVLDRFRTGLDKVLITMNALSSGINVGQVDSILNFDLPVHQNGEADLETYTRCVCRTGSIGKSNEFANLL